ncbi:MAG TPA: alpha/beta hydrolase [Caulobacteraceae bacterium]|nr:alpha/beta hydrolase [Caulobacteraceae bacterium]
MLDPHFKVMLDELAKIEMPPLAVLPPEMVREGYRATRVGLDAGAPRDLDVRDLTVDGAEGPLKARLYTPKGVQAPGPGIVYFHGGGFVIGDLDTHDSFLRRLAASSGVRVMAVDYRLAPEHPFPAPHDDALAATRWAFDHAAEIGFDPKKIAIGGDSAGGNLAASISLEMRDDPQRRLAFQLLLYPATAMEQDTASRRDLAEGHVLTREAMEWFGQHLNAGGHAQAHRAEPGNVDDLSGAPACLVVTAGFDPLKDEGKAYAEKLTAAGVSARHVEHAGFVHDFYILGHVCPKVFDVIDETAQALRDGLA